MKWTFTRHYHTLTFSGKERAILNYRRGNGYEAFVYDKHGKPIEKKIFTENDTTEHFLKQGVTLTGGTEEALTMYTAKMWAEKIIIKNTPKDELPLFIGQLEFEKSKEILERRLRG